MALDAAKLERAFTAIERAAINGERCPFGAREGVEGLPTGATTALARAGRIKVEISGRNWRTVTILTGPHAGKRTKPDPTLGHIYQTIGLKSEWTPQPINEISRFDAARRAGRSAHQGPSPPRALSPDELRRRG